MKSILFSNFTGEAAGLVVIQDPITRRSLAQEALQFFGYVTSGKTPLLRFSVLLQQ